MNPKKRKMLEAAGWRVGDYGDFLGLTEEERQEVELRGALSDAIQRRRNERGLTKKQLSSKLKLSPLEVSNLELGIDVTLDVLFRALFVLGGTIADIARPRRRKSVARS
jgi:helix-turn-helix protein